MRLHYCGNGAFLPGVPARDLTAAEVAQLGGPEKLLESGLYRLPAKRDVVGGRENKLTHLTMEVKNG